MHDRDELRSEPGLHITDDVFNCGSNSIVGRERGVHDDTEVFHLEISLIQGFEGTAIIKVMVEWYCEVGVHDGGDEHGMFSGGWE